MVKEEPAEHVCHEFDYHSGRTFTFISLSVALLSVSAPPTPYYFFYARVSCRVCIVPKYSKTMEYLLSLVKSRKEKLLAFTTLLSVGYVTRKCKSVPRLGKL